MIFISDTRALVQLNSLPESFKFKHIPYKIAEHCAYGVGTQHTGGCLRERVKAARQGAGCRVQGAGCRVQGAGCRVQGRSSELQGSAGVQQPSTHLPELENDFE